MYNSRAILALPTHSSASRQLYAFCFVALHVYSIFGCAIQVWRVIHDAQAVLLARVEVDVGFDHMRQSLESVFGGTY